jgi:aminopeptidase N
LGLNSRRRPLRADHFALIFSETPQHAASRAWKEVGCMKVLKIVFMLLLILIPATGWCLDVRYDLDIRIDPERKTLTGTGIISSPGLAVFDLSVAGLQDVLINDRPVNPDGPQSIAVRMTGSNRIRITFTKAFDDSGQGFMDRENVFLSGLWYPQPDAPVHYRLAATLPENFIAVSEADTVSVKRQLGQSTFFFHFDKPLEGLHLAASTRYSVKTAQHAGIAIETYFFKADAALADTYIDYAKKYLDMYTGMLTPYPYRRFAIVENILPTGYSMPTFTLLGRTVVNLPFIVRTSLGHEILHQWFGNSVYIDTTHGNWAEGLTSYLADHHYAELDNRAPAYRKQILLNYRAYVNADNALPVSSFLSRRDRAQAAIGYGKAAMIFHMLRRRVGSDLFFESLRKLIRENAFCQAGWPDIRHAFEQTSGENLEPFFKQWLDRGDIPDLRIENTKLTSDGDALALRFDILQAKTPYRLSIPVTVTTARSSHTRSVAVTRSPQEVVIPLDSPPLEVVIDKEYSIMRTLDAAEQPPILADIMGDQNLLAAVPAEHRAVYKPLVDALGIKAVTWLDPGKVTFTRLKTATLLIAGFDNPLAAVLLGGRTTPQDGIRLEVYKNPYALEKRLLLMHAASAAESKTMARRLSHYGQYSALAFTGGHNTHKSIAAAANGIAVFSRPRPAVLRPARKETLADIYAELHQNRVIFVGEQHDRLAHHLNQLQVIQALHAAGEKIGVGMEMFQTPYQPAIDAYLAGEIDERTFLARSAYYDRWRYDYHLYKPIIDFLKANRIPLVALNISGDISRQTGRQGLDSLSPEQRRQVPHSLDFTDETYRRDLKQVYDQHGSEAELDEFNYFYQAQTLWDETMASTAARWLAGNPQRKLVVLAGNGHLRYKYGIPRRLYRRTQQPYTVIVQDEEVESGIADYVLFTTAIEGIESPRLGIMVEETEGALVIKRAIEHGPAGKAGLEDGDIITALDGHPIKSLADLKIALFYTHIGDRIHLAVDRGGVVLDKEIELKAHPKHIPMTER